MTSNKEPLPNQRKPESDQADDDKEKPVAKPQGFGGPDYRAAIRRRMIELDEQDKKKVDH